MAEANKIYSEYPVKAQIAVIPNTKCQLCEENQISWKCFTCEEYLCHHCKRAHLKSKASRDHKVTSIRGADKRETEETENEDDLKCSTHPNEAVIMFCKDCDVLLCIDCIANSSHKNHSFSKMEDIIDEKQKELSNIIDKSKVKLSSLEHDMNSSKQIHEEFSSGITKCMADVQSRNVQLKTALDQVTSETVQELQKLDEENKKSLQAKEKTNGTSISQLKELINRCEEKQHQRKPGIIRLVKKLTKILEQFTIVKPQKQFSPPPTFVSKEETTQEVKALFGGLNHGDQKGYHPKRAYDTRPHRRMKSDFYPTDKFQDENDTTGDERRSPPINRPITAKKPDNSDVPMQHVKDMYRHYTSPRARDTARDIQGRSRYTAYSNYSPGEKLKPPEWSD